MPDLFKFIFAEMFRCCFVVFLLIPYLSANAQLRHMDDSIRYDLKQKRSLFVSLDGKNSVIRDIPIKQFGLQVGYLYNKRTALYIGYYGSYNDSRIIDRKTAELKKLEYDSNTIWQKYQLNYFSIGAEYYFHNSRKWRMSIPASIGIGRGLARQWKLSGITEENKYIVIPLEVGFKASYKLTWWLWINGGLGSRVSLASSKFNGPYYSFGFSIKTGEIYRRTKAWYEDMYK